MLPDYLAHAFNPNFEKMDHITPVQDLQALHDLCDQALSDFDPKSGELRQAVEVGSWAGLTALVLAHSFDKVYCIDHWQGNPNDRVGAIAQQYGYENVFKTFCKNMGTRLLRTVIPCRGDSATWAAMWPFPVRLVFVDANHDYECVKADIAAWLPHVAPGGILCGHDYGGFEGVTRAVKELHAKIPVNLAGACIWWARVPP